MKRKLFRFLSASVIIFTIFCCIAVPRAYAAETPGSPIFTQEEKDYISSHKKVRVGFVQDRIPVSFTDENGEFAGISRYILDRVSQICGLKFEYVPIPAGEVTYEVLLKNKYDLVTSVEYNEANKKANGILISEPYLSSRKVIVTRDDLNFNPDAHMTVAISTGSQTIKKVLGEMYPSFKLIDYDSIPACFDAVHNGSVDLTIQNQYVVEYWFSKPSYENLQAIPALGLDDQSCFSAVVAFEGSEGAAPEEGQILIDILDKAIAKVNENEIGSYTIKSVLENQYDFTTADFMYHYRYAMGILAASAVVVIVLLIILFRQHLRVVSNRADAKAKGEFLSTMSHEIRTPLNGLIGLNYLMTQKMDDKEQLTNYLTQSTVTAKYLLSLVNDILDMSKLQAKKLELVLHPVDLGLTLNTVGSIVQNGMMEKRLDYRVHTDLLCPYVMGDEVRIQQVILNLLDNARKFTPGGGKVDLSLKQEMTAKGKVRTIITVTDTGRGMSEEFQKRIFDAFAQELETVSKGNQGTGLGLPISHSLALLMDGDLTFTSKKGEGSTFTFTFTADSSDPPQKNAAVPATPGQPRPKILIAEDNELNGEILMDLLESDGFESALAENGRLAVEMFSESAPGTYQVILMDLLMPEMDGYEAAKAIRAMDRPDAKTVRILACSANSFSEDRRKAQESGMDDFISKPVDVPELLKKLNG